MMSFVIRPVKSPPKIKEFEMLSAEAQKTMLALEEKYARLLSQLQPPVVTQNDPSSYYKSIYKATFNTSSSASVPVQADSDCRNSRGPRMTRNCSSSHYFSNASSNAINSVWSKEIFNSLETEGISFKGKTYQEQMTERNTKKEIIIIENQPSEREIEESVLSLTQRISDPNSPAMELDFETSSQPGHWLCERKSRNMNMATDDDFYVNSFPPSTTASKQCDFSKVSQTKSSTDSVIPSRSHTLKLSEGNRNFMLPEAHRETNAGKSPAAPNVFDWLEKDEQCTKIYSTQESSVDIFSSIWPSADHCKNYVNDELGKKSVCISNANFDKWSNEVTELGFELNLSDFECTQHSSYDPSKERHNSQTQPPDMNKETHTNFSDCISKSSDLQKKTSDAERSSMVEMSLTECTEDPLEKMVQSNECPDLNEGPNLNECPDSALKNTKCSSKSSTEILLKNSDLVSQVNECESPCKEVKKLPRADKSSHDAKHRKRKKLWPIFQGRNDAEECSRKDSTHITSVSSAANTGTHSKRMKPSFKPPTKVKHTNCDVNTSSTKETTESNDLPEVVSLSSMSWSKCQDTLDLLKSSHTLILALLYSDGLTTVNTFYSAAEFAKRKNTPEQPQITEIVILSEQCQAQCFLIPKECLTTTSIRETLLTMLQSKKVIKVIPNCKEFLIGLYQLLSRESNNELVCEEVEDPVIGCWLIDPENQPCSFSQMCDTVKMTSTVIDEVWLTCLQSTLQLMQTVRAKLKSDKHWLLYTQIEMKLVPMLAYMETRTIKVDANVFIRFSDILKKKLRKLEDAVHKEAGHKFSVTSHVQLRQVLYEQLKLDQKLPTKTKIGKTSVANLKSTCEASLKLLAEVHPLPSLILEYRQLQKLKSTYVDGMMSCVTNGVLRTHWDQTAAATGRLTSSHPNVQAIPKAVITITDFETNFIIGSERTSTADIYAREPFICRDGHMFLAADFQQIELRVLAHLSEDSSLLSLFWQPQSADVFVSLTSQWKNKSMDSVTQADREQTKRIVYSVMYGVGKDKLAEYLNVKPDIAKDIMNSFLLQFPGVDSFTKKCCAYAKEYGYTETLCGRRRYFPHINSTSPGVRAQAQRQAVNFCVQGSAADLCKLAMLTVENKLKENPHLKCSLLLQIHDELVWEVPQDQLQETKALIQLVMEDSKALCGNFCSLQVPLTVALSSGKSWAHLLPCGSCQSQLTD